MKAWLIKHQKGLSLGIGALLVVVSIAMLFWTNMGNAVSDEERLAAASVARMEARMAGKSTASQSNPQKMDFMGTYVEEQKMQLRYMLIAMLVGGVCFLGYGFLKKSGEEE